MISRDHIWMVDLGAIEAAKLYQRTQWDVYSRRQREMYLKDFGISSMTGSELTNALKNQQKVAGSGIDFVARLCLRVLHDYVANEHEKIPPIIEKAVVLAQDWVKTARTLEFLEFPKLPQLEDQAEVLP